MRTIIENIRVWTWKQKYRPGKVVTQFIARDIRRDIEVMDVTEIAKGVITGKTRTWNVLYASKELQDKPPFGNTRRLEIERLWDWAGESWGGSVPESTDRKNE